MTAETPEDPAAYLKQLAGSFQRIKLGSGVVGKSSYAMFALICAWIVIFLKMSDSLIQNVFLAGGGLTLTAVYCWWTNRTQKFAEKHPSMALLEGAQFIEFKKWEAEIKGLPKLSSKVIPKPPAIDVTPESGGK